MHIADWGFVREVLVRISHPLELDWVRSFMLPDAARETPEMLRAWTTQESLEYAFTFFGSITMGDSTGLDSSNLSGISNIFNSLLVPCCTVGDMTVGFAICKESEPSLGLVPSCERIPSKIDLSQRTTATAMNPRHHHLHFQGRFCFSQLTGELLLIQELMPHEIQIGHELLEILAESLGRPTRLRGGSAQRGNVVRISWVGGLTVRQGKLFLSDNGVSYASIDVKKGEYLKGNFGEATVGGSYCSSLTRIFESRPASGRAVDVCTWLKALKPGKKRTERRVRPQSIAGRPKFMKTALYGAWSGSIDIFAPIPGIAGPGVCCSRSVQAELGFTGARSELCSLLQMLALDRSMHGVSVTRQILPPLQFDFGLRPGQDESTKIGIGHPSRRRAVGFVTGLEKESDSAATWGPNPMCHASEVRKPDHDKALEERRSRNRLSAHVSYQKQSMDREALKQSVKLERKRATELMTREMNLRRENIQLRTELELRRASTASKAANKE